MSTKHLKTPKIPENKEDMKEWAKSFGNLRYDQLAEFIFQLSDKIMNDAELDISRGRRKLGSKLLDCGEQLFEAYVIIEEVEKICEPFMKDENGDS